MVVVGGAGGVFEGVPRHTVCPNPRDRSIQPNSSHRGWKHGMLSH